jgi:tetratricopeptide (TPR) repeat protein
VKDDHDHSGPAVPSAAVAAAAAAQASRRVTSAEALRVAAQHHQAGRPREAEAIYRALLQQIPPGREPVILLGMLLSDHGRCAEAADVYRAALRWRANDAELWDELALVLARLRDFPEAERAARQAVALNPADALLHVHLGNVLTESDRAEEAVPIYRAAIERVRDAGHAVEAWYNLGVALHELGRAAEAAAALERAIALDPGFAEAHTKLGTALLRGGDFRRGWAKYEWRWRVGNVPSHEGSVRPNLDRANGGGDVILESDQGLGDAIQMVRYAPMVAARAGGARVIVRCQPELHRLFSTAAGVAGVTSTDAPPPRDARATRVSMMSLPYVFDTAPETIPAAVPYLRADDSTAITWTRALSGDRAPLRVGVAWAGNPSHRDDRRRSCPPEQLRALGAVPGVTFYSLQKHGGAGGGGVLPFPLIDHTAALRDLADTAALIANLDLVITVDTAVAHLSAAMAKPTWILLARAADWRWMLDRDDTPWYPTVRLFRQAQPGGWHEPVKRATAELARMAAAATRADAASDR